MIAQAYVDESGGKGQGPALVLSSWLGDALNWAAFSHEWQACIDASPRIRYFKFTHAARIKGEFHGFSVAERDAKVRELARVIKRNAITEQFHIVDLGAFAESAFAVGSKPMRDPYFLPFQLAIVGIAHELRKRGHTEQCEIIFDENVIFGPRAKEWYPILKAIMEPDIQAVMPIEPSFRSDTDALPLQAADMTAGLRGHTLNREDDSFDEWLWAELDGAVNVSEHSAIIDASLLNNLFPSPDMMRKAWSGLEAYLDTFGGDAIEMFRFWAEEAQESLKRQSANQNRQ